MKTVLQLLFLLVAALLFTTIQSLLLRKSGRTSLTFVKEELERAGNSKTFKNFVGKKQIWLKKHGADVFLQDGILVSRWYLYKFIMAAFTESITYLIAVKVFQSGSGIHITVVSTVIAWFFLDIYLVLEDKQSKEAMMADICEMSRSVLYGKKGGQYIIDAIKDAVLVVENKRLKMAMIRMKTDLDAGRSLDEALSDFELSFSSVEIASFCTVIRSLQSTGHVEEALKSLENNIERGQAGVNKRQCIVLENKTLAYVMMIAFDLLIMILYCIIMKLLDMQIAF